MKNRAILLFSFILFAAAMRAQDTIAYSLTIVDAGCNGLIGGSTKVNVHETHPPYTFRWSTGSSSNAVYDLSPGDYFLTIIDSIGTDTVVTIHIGERQCKINAEIVFTPNGDGHNDTWEISNINYFPDNFILVYNRWGQKVFEHHGDYEPWDGRDLLGVPVPESSYYYIIYEDHADENSIVKGCVSVVR